MTTVAKKSANTSATDKPKRKAPRTAWKKGDPSPNPAGAPKRGESWAEIIKQYGDLTPSEAAVQSLELVKKLLSIGDGVTLKQAVVLRVYADLLHAPTPGLLTAFMERADGKVADKLELHDWRVQYGQNGADPDTLVEMVNTMQAMGEGGKQAWEQFKAMLAQAQTNHE